MRWISRWDELAPGMPGLRVVNFAKLKVQAEVAEAYISKVKQGDPVEVFFPISGVCYRQTQLCW